MKTTLRSRLRSVWIKFDTRADTFTLSKAKIYLGRLASRAAQAKVVFIVRGSQRFSLQHVPEIEPIPQRPPGFFENCYTREEMELENRLSTASPVEKPEGLE
jgi:hypothetical protein